MTRQERHRAALRKDQRTWGGSNTHVVRAEHPKRGAVQTPVKISGKETSLGALLDRAVERMCGGMGEE